ncbi:MAG: hypothetical protein RMM98_16090, partial [Acidobacteriota bacterium]|nr:hypothetical protein [Acidobacteriota bacterium]
MDTEGKTNKKRLIGSYKHRDKQPVDNLLVGLVTSQSNLDAGRTSFQPPVSLQSKQVMDVQTLEIWLWGAACVIRGPVDAPKFK